MATHFEDTPGLYSAANMDCRLATAQSWYLDVPVRSATPGALEFVAYHQLEGGRDSAFVEFSGDDGATWTTMLAMTGRGERITRHSVPVGPEWASSAFRFAFRVKTNGILQDSGFHVKDIRLSWNGSAVGLRQPERPEEPNLAVWPNPFNPSATLRLALPARAAGARAEIALFDLLGRRVLALPPREALATGQHEFRLEAGHLPAGLYFAQIRLEQGGREIWQGVQGLTLVK
jgi:hypothetical protein